MSNEIVTETHGRVQLITLNRPEARNAVNSALGQALVAAIDALDADDGLTAGVLTGAGGGFSAGMDLKAFATEGPPKGFTQFLQHGSQKPLIAAVEGFALAGGLEIALTCDLIVAAKGVKLGLPEVNKGLFAAGGGLFRLPARVPYGVAMEMALTSDPILAEQYRELQAELIGKFLALFDRLIAQGQMYPPQPSDDLVRVATNAFIVWSTWVNFLTASRSSPDVTPNDRVAGALQSFLVFAPYLDEGFAAEVRSVLDE